MVKIGQQDMLCYGNYQGKININFLSGLGT